MDGEATLIVNTLANAFDYYGVDREPYIGYLHRGLEKLTENTSKLTMQIVYKSPADREAMLKLPFAKGINMAHNRLEQVVKQLI